MWLDYLAFVAVILWHQQYEDPLNRWKAMNQRGLELTALGLYGEADGPFRKALLEAERLPVGHPARTKAVNNVAANCIRLGNYREPERLLNALIRYVEWRLGARHFSLVEPLTNLASLQRNAGRTVLAGRMLQRAIECLEENPTASPRNSAQNLRMRIATNLVQEGRLDEAEREFEHLMVIWVHAEGVNDVGYLALLNNYGDLMIRRKRLAEARQMLGEALAIASATLPADHPELIAPLANLAFVYSCERQYAKGAETWRRAIEILQRSGDRRSWLCGWMLTQQAAAVRHLRRKDEAKELEQQGSSIMAKADLEMPGRHTVDLVELAAGMRHKRPK
jgi:tetratricopeptide (TPR) repeat protein